MRTGGGFLPQLVKPVPVPCIRAAPAGLPARTPAAAGISPALWRGFWRFWGGRTFPAVLLSCITKWACLARLAVIEKKNILSFPAPLFPRGTRPRASAARNGQDPRVARYVSPTGAASLLFYVANTLAKTMRRCIVCVGRIRGHGCRYRQSGLPPCPAGADPGLWATRVDLVLAGTWAAWAVRQQISAP